MIKIGVMEDDDGERRLIKIAIAQCCEEEVIFVDYVLQDMADADLEAKIINEIEKDIVQENIQGLIIDQNIRTKTGFLHGSNIYIKLLTEIREFPFIILTNYGSMAAKERMVDSDKIYEKENFITVENENSIKNVKSFIRNIKRFIEIRMKLENDFERLQEDFKKGKLDDRSIDDMVLIENTLSNYKIGEKFIAERQLENIDFDDIMQVIEKVGGLINGE